MVMLDRSGAWEPNDCGDGKGTSGAAYQCPAIVSDGGVDGGNGNDGGIDGGGSAGGGGSSSAGGSGNAGGGGGKSAPSPHGGACVCNVSGRGPTSGTMTLLALPWLLVGMRLCSKARCK